MEPRDDPAEPPVDPYENSPEAIASGSIESTQPTKPTHAAPEAQRLAEALAELPEAEREAVAEHVAALARLSPRRRGAILALTEDEQA